MIDYKFRFKNSVALFLSCLMICLPLCSYTVNSIGLFLKSGDFEYIVLEDETVSITDYFGFESNFTIPSELDGYEVSGIGDFAFENNASLKKLVIPKTIQELGYGCFQSCISLEEVEIENNMSELGCCFSGCKNLKRIILPNSIKIIGACAFSDCESLEEIILPENTHTIGYDAFYNCKTIKNIFIPKNVSVIGYDAFRKCTSLEEINVSKENEYFYGENGVLFNKEKTELICCPAGKKDISYTVDDCVISITDHAFLGCNELDEIFIPSTVDSIGKFAVGYCFDENSDILKKENFKIFGIYGSQAEFYAMANEIEFEQLFNKIIGDVNNDGIISLIDAKWILQSMAGIRFFDEYQIKSADANSDGKVSIVDAKWVLQVIAGARVL